MFRRWFAQTVAPLAVLVAVFLFGPGQRTAFAQANASSSDPTQKGPPITPPSPPPQSSGPTTPSSESSAFMSEPGIIESMMDFTTQRFGDGTGTPKSGFYPELSNMITGSGWVSVGPGYKRYFANDHALFDTSAAISWRMYKMAQMRFELPQQANGHLRLGTQFMWQDNTQVNYFGIGPDIAEDDRSQYRMQSHDLVGYGMYTPSDTLTISGKFGWLGHPKLMDPGGTFIRDFPSTLEAFPQDPAASLSEQPAFLHSEAAITSDTRDHRGHPTRGAMYRAALTNYWDRSTGFYTFHTWEAEGAQYVPLSDTRIVLAFHGWTVASNPSNEHDVPFYLLPAIGGSRTLRDYHDFQFHDNNVLVVNAEVRFAVWTHLDAALFGDAGNVGHHYGDLNLDKTSWGAGLRLHNEHTTLARMDIAHGAQQGFRVVFSTTEPFRLPRVRRTTAIIPFTP